jgi:DNA-binding NtrC family response regulator
VEILASNPRVLVVDDDLLLLGMMEEALRGREGLDVRAAATFEAAVASLETERFDIVVTDYSLGDPSLTGLEVLRRARRLHPELLGIIVTAYASLEVSLEAIRLGAYNFLTKPFQVDELLLAVRNAADRVRLSAENAHLRAQVAQLAESLRRVGADHADLMAQLKALGANAGALIDFDEAGPVRRRDVTSKIQTYLAVGETIGERLDRENRRLETLFRQGLISEPTYRKGRRADVEGEAP